MTTEHVFELTWDEANQKFTVAKAYPIPAKYSWSGKAEHIDFGHKRFVIMSPIGCSNTATTAINTVVAKSPIANPSAKFFQYSDVTQVTTYYVDDGSQTDVNGNTGIAGNHLIDATEHDCD